MGDDVTARSLLSGVLHRQSGRLVAVLLLFVTMAAAAQQAQDAQMVIVLDQQTGSTVHTVSGQHIFKTGDMVAFRVNSSLDGFLYVTNRAASGKYSELFPGPKAAGGNWIRHGQEYRIPASRRAWFRIEEPAGYETVYFTLTHAPLTRSGNSASSPDMGQQHRPVPSPPPGGELMPRCDDSLLRSRGECLDVSAGQGAVSPGTEASRGATPDLGSVTPEDSSGATALLDDVPLVYEFRIAHR